MSEMSPFWQVVSLVVLVIDLVAFAVLLGLLATGDLTWTRRSPVYQPEPEPEPELAHVPEPREQEQAKPPLPIDPKNPPQVMNYRPRTRDVDQPLVCYCHGHVVRGGQKVWLWPLGDGRSALVCYEEA